ncbi:MAG TPA: hypothetical protein VH395_06750 [Jatrophihabitantaceae bacterium]|jgi:hypothetical protein
MYTIPKELITEWDNVKKNLGPAIDKIKLTTMITAADKTRMKAQATKLLGEFDQGLKAKMKIAANAKTDDDARKAAAVVAGVAVDYRKSVDKASAQWGLAAKAIIDPVDKVLVKIERHALASTKSRAPITFTKELDDILETFRKGTANIVASIPALNLDDDDAEAKLTTSVTNLIGNLDLLVAKKVTPAKTARSEDALHTALVDLAKAIESGRKRAQDTAKSWPPKARTELAKRLDFPLVQMGRKATTLLTTLDQA